MYRDRIMWIKEKKRQTIQVISAVLYNSNFCGFASGEIYKGSIKSICVPGLNCYSCPGAIASCPLGSFQTALVSSKYKGPYYIFGVLLLFGTLFGRTVCGYLCPFGLLQEILYLIPAKKVKKSKYTRFLCGLKYIILAVFVIGAPLILAAPGFCKYICPAGTLEGGMILAAMNEQIRELTGGLFDWKVFLLVLIMISAICVFRSFCRFICPLGAFYSLFNHFSLIGVRVDAKKCTGCRRCITSCRMDVKCIGDRECIQCGKCVNECPVKAVKFTFHEHFSNE